MNSFHSLQPVNAAFAAIVVAVMSLSATASPYVAILDDGSQVTGDELGGLMLNVGEFSLDGKRIATKSASLRLLCSRQFVKAPTAFLQLINGDILPGDVERIVTEAETPDVVPHLVVNTRTTAGIMRVRLDAVKAIQFMANSRPARPNVVKLKKAQEFEYRSLRWQSNGLKLLTADGVVEASLDELVYLTMPAAEPMMPLPGAGWFEDTTQPLRLTTLDGMIVTIASTMISDDLSDLYLKSRGLRLRNNDSTLFATRPFWSLDPLLFASQNVASLTVLKRDELPLPLLSRNEMNPEATWSQQVAVLNRGLGESLLASGKMVSELGIATHAPSQLAFELPENADSFSSWVGMDQRSGSGGCVRCSVYGDKVAGQPLWQSEYLQGSDGAVKFGPVNIRGVKRLILVVDAAHEGRPEGADPLDIRDDVNWMMPMVRTEPDEGFRNARDLAWWIPALKGWNVGNKNKTEIKLTPNWSSRIANWSIPMKVDDGFMHMSRSLKVDLNNAWLQIGASRDSIDGWGHEIAIAVNGEQIASTENAKLRSSSRVKSSERCYSLANFAGQDIELQVQVRPSNLKRSHADGIIWKQLSLEPLISELGSQRQPIQPDVLLDELAAVSAVVDNNPIELHPGKCTTGTPLELHQWRFTQGVGVPSNSRITYDLDPSYQRFVAVIGLAEGEVAAGPFVVEFDGELAWSSEQTLGLTDPARQINVAIPANAKQITLRIEGNDSQGAWAQSGFLTQ